MLIFLSLLKLVITSSLKNYTDDRILCYKALALAKICQCPKLFYYDEAEVHRKVFSLRLQGKAYRSSAFKEVLVLTEKRYLGYVQKVNEKNLGIERVGVWVNKKTKENARGYLPRVTKINVFQYAPVAHLLSTLKYHQENNDHVRHAYYLSALEALEAYASTYHDYKNYTRLPIFHINTSLERYLTDDLKKFIDTKLGKFDYGASYPDSVMCISLLQFLKYMALLDGNLELVRSSLVLYQNAAMALENMLFKPVRALSFATRKGRVTVCMMPQEKVEPKVIPAFLIEEDNPMLMISIREFEDPYDNDKVMKRVEMLEIYPSLVT